MTTLPEDDDSIQTALGKQTFERVRTLHEIALSFDDANNGVPLSKADFKDLFGHLADAYMASRRAGRLAHAEAVSRYRATNVVMKMLNLPEWTATEVVEAVLATRSSSLRGALGLPQGTDEERQDMDVRRAVTHHPEPRSSQ